MITPSSAQPDTLQLYGYLPQFVQDNDAAGGYQFLSWIDGFISEGSEQTTLTYNYDYDDGIVTKLPVAQTVSNNPIPACTGIQAIDDLVRDSQYNPGWSAILDINRCPTYALPWLGQFVGVRLGQTTNDALMRQTILAENAFTRGTTAAIQLAAQRYLIPPYVAVVQERTSFIGGIFGYDPYAITITFPGAGVNALTYGQLFAEYPNYAAVQSAFATYADMAGNTANLESAVLAVVPAGLFVYFNPTT